MTAAYEAWLAAVRELSDHDDACQERHRAFACTVHIRLARIEVMTRHALKEASAAWVRSTEER